LSIPPLAHSPPWRICALISPANTAAVPHLDIDQRIAPIGAQKLLKLVVAP
jgi:hypothetical protein